MIGISASAVDDAGALGAADGDGEAATVAVGDGTTDGGADAAPLAEGVGVAEGDGAAAMTVNEVVPRAVSPSSVETVVQRIVYAPGASGVASDRVIVRGAAFATSPPFATTVPPASTRVKELFAGSRFWANVPTISLGAGPEDLSAGVIVSSAAWPRAVSGAARNAVAARSPRSGRRVRVSRRGGPSG
jgi:hypothetical protein